MVPFSNSEAREGKRPLVSVGFQMPIRSPWLLRPLGTQTRECAGAYQQARAAKPCAGE